MRVALLCLLFSCGPGAIDPFPATDAGADPSLFGYSAIEWDWLCLIEVKRGEETIRCLSLTECVPKYQPDEALKLDPHPDCPEWRP